MGIGPIPNPHYIIKIYFIKYLKYKIYLIKKIIIKNAKLF